MEEKLDLSGVGAPKPAAAEPATGASPPPEGRVLREVEAEVDGRRFRVRLWVPDVGPAPAAGPAGQGRPARQPRAGGGAGGGAAGSGQVTVPMQGTIVKVLVEAGEVVEVGQTICVLEAMKMENNINAEAAGTVAEVRVKPGDTVSAGDVVAIVSVEAG